MILTKEEIKSNGTINFIQTHKHTHSTVFWNIIPRRCTWKFSIFYNRKIDNEISNEKIYRLLFATNHISVQSKLNRIALMTVNRWNWKWDKMYNLESNVKCFLRFIFHPFTPFGMRFSFIFVFKKQFHLLCWHINTVTKQCNMEYEWRSQKMQRAIQLDIIILFSSKKNKLH